MWDRFKQFSVRGESSSFSIGVWYISGDTTVIGKPQGSDLARSKPTYPSLLGADGARNYLSQLLESALASIEMFGEEGDLLRDMAGYVVARTH